MNKLSKCPVPIVSKTKKTKNLKNSLSAPGKRNVCLVLRVNLTFHFKDSCGFDNPVRIQMLNYAFFVFFADILSKYVLCILEWRILLSIALLYKNKPVLAKKYPKKNSPFFCLQKPFLKRLLYINLKKLRREIKHWKIAFFCIYKLPPS